MLERRRGHVHYRYHREEEKAMGYKVAHLLRKVCS